MPKVVNFIAGVVLLLCGLVGCFYPDLVGEYYGMRFDQLDAKTTVRVLGGFCAGVGSLFVFFAITLQQQRPLLFCLMVVLASFALPRMLGLYIDGFNQASMVYELIFEAISLVFIVGVFLTMKPVNR